MKWIRRAVVAILLLVTWGAMLPTALRIVDPMTHQPLASERQPYLEAEPFPYLVVTDDGPRVEEFSDIAHPPLAEIGTAFLVPPGQSDALERQLRKQNTEGVDGRWTIRVDQLGPGRQKIELVWLDDGYFGSVYEATRHAIKPLYRKHTGPGFAFCFGTLALGLSAIVWGSVWLIWHMIFRRVFASRSSP